MFLIPTPQVLQKIITGLDDLYAVSYTHLGAVVGTTFKKDGIFENNVEKSGVVAFMDKVHSIR